MRRIYNYIFLLALSPICMGDQGINKLTIFSKNMTLPATCKLRHIDKEGGKFISCLDENSAYSMHIYTLNPEGCKKEYISDSYKGSLNGDVKEIEDTNINGFWYFELKASFDEIDLTMYQRVISNNNECISISVNSKAVLDQFTRVIWH